jgi:threonine synthase
MGAPIGRIVLAVNENDILARAIVTGRYERAAQSRATLSPAMDIQVASNFERILFEALGRDAKHLRRLYAQFDQSGGFDIPANALANLREDFYAISIDNEDTARMMTFAWSGGHHGALVCPHTAVGLLARAQLANELGLAPTVVLATAHPAKFPETVESATGVRPPLPLHCADLYQRTEKFDTLPADAEAVKAYIRERTRAWA